MKQIKFFELRDHCTRIPIACTRFDPQSFEDMSILEAAGWPERGPLLLVPLAYAHKPAGDHYVNSRYAINDRTFSTAYRYIEENFDALESGTVIDVRTILGESEPAHPEIPNVRPMLRL